jgi:hypothetical protein
MGPAKLNFVEQISSCHTWCCPSHPQDLYDIMKCAHWKQISFNFLINHKLPYWLKNCLLIDDPPLINVGSLSMYMFVRKIKLKLNVHGRIWSIGKTWMSSLDSKLPYGGNHYFHRLPLVRNHLQKNDAPKPSMDMKN